MIRRACTHTRERSSRSSLVCARVGYPKLTLRNAREGRMVDLTGASWNQVTPWLIGVRALGQVC
jgi:hypothetical protein